MKVLIYQSWIITIVKLSVVFITIKGEGGGGGGYNEPASERLIMLQIFLQYTFLPIFRKIDFVKLCLE